MLYRLVRNQRGAALLVVVLLALAATLALAAAAAASSSGESRAVEYETSHDQAFYMAESGLNHAMWKLQYEGTTVPDRVYPNDPPSFDSTEAEVAGDLPAGASYKVWVLTDSVDRSAKHVTVQGISAKQSYVLKATVRQVSKPFYDPTSTGVITSNPDDPAILGPDLPNQGWLKLVNNQTYTFNGGEFFFEGIDMTNNCTIRLTADTILWVRQSIKMTNNCIMNVLSDNHKLIIFMPEAGIAQSIKLVNNCQLNAFVYAPDASANLTNNCSATGLLIVDSINTVNGCHYSPTGEGEPWPASAIVKYELLSYGQ